jgi:DNA polymerase III subunit beta
MKLTIERQPLLRALGIAHRVIERRNTIPILGNILFTATTGELSIKATDLDIEISLSAPCDVETGGQTTIPGHLLHDIVRKVPDGALVSLEVQQQGQITVRSGRSRFTLQTLPAIDYPDIAHGALPCRFSMPSKALLRIIDKTAFAVSTEETRYYLNGIFLHARPSDEGLALRAAATDGHRLARAFTDMPSLIEGDAVPDMIVPRKTVGEIQRLLEGAGEVMVSCSATKIVVEAGGTRLISKLIDGTFPDYERVIPRGNSKRLIVSKSAFAAMMDRVTTMASERGRVVKLSLQDGRMTASVNNPDAGSSSDEIDVLYEDAPLDIGFNSRYMLDILGAVECDETLVQLGTPGDPILISPHGITSHDLFVLMPVRVSNHG